MPPTILPNVARSAAGPAQFDAGRVAQMQNSAPAQLQENGEAVQQAAMRIDRARMIAEREAEQKQREVDVAQVKTSDIALSDAARAVMRDPNTGYLNMRGEAATSGRKAAFDAYDEHVKVLRSALKNQWQIDNFDRIAADRRVSMAEVADAHESRERNSWLASAAALRSDSMAADAIDLFDPDEHLQDPQPAAQGQPPQERKEPQADRFFRMAVSEAEEAARREGRDPGAAGREKADVIHSGRLGVMIDDQQVGPARAYFDKHSTELDPTTRLRVSRMLVKAERQVRTVTIARDAIGLAMDSLEKSKAGLPADDPRARITPRDRLSKMDEAISYIASNGDLDPLQREDATDFARKQRKQLEDALADHGNSLLEQAKTALLADPTRDPNKLPQTMLEDLADHDALDDLVTYAANGGQVRTDFGMFWAAKALPDEALREMTPQVLIRTFGGKLAPEEMKSLLSRHALLSGSGKADDFEIRSKDQLLDDKALLYGLKSDAEKAAFRERVHDAVRVNRLKSLSDLSNWFSDQEKNHIYTYGGRMLPLVALDSVRKADAVPQGGTVPIGRIHQDFRNGFVGLRPGAVSDADVEKAWLRAGSPKTQREIAAALEWLSQPEPAPGEKTKVAPPPQRGTGMTPMQQFDARRQDELRSFFELK